MNKHALSKLGIGTGAQKNAVVGFSCEVCNVSHQQVMLSLIHYVLVRSQLHSKSAIPLYALITYSRKEIGVNARCLAVEASKQGVYNAKTILPS